MLSIRQFPYGADNLAYVIHGNSDAVVIDGGAPAEILEYLSARKLSLRYVTNTHDHPDHIPGNGFFLKMTGAAYLSPLEAASLSTLLLEDEPIHIYATPGHTGDSVTFHTGNALITGDTLFNGTVGNCFSGDLTAFYNSLHFLLSLPEEALVYPGHDYMASAMAFARNLEPGNPHIDDYLRKYDPKMVCSTLGDERRVNPYLRFNDPAMIRLLEEKGLPVSTELSRFTSIMSLG